LNTLAIVIVSWNAKGYLLDCLRSIHEHPFHSSLEVVVVDNHSSDGSPKAVAEQFPQVTLIRNGTNLGFARGNNLGITQTNSRYVALVNSDVVVLPGCLNRLVEYMDAHPEVGLCGPRILNPDGSLQPSCRKKPRLWGSLCTTFSLHQLFRRSCFFSGPFMNFFAHDRELEVDVLSGCFWMASREAIREVGLLDEAFFMYAEDLDWCKRFHNAGWGVKFFPGAEAIHHGGKSSENAPVQFFVEMQKANLQYWQKHHRPWEQQVFLLLFFLHQCFRIISRSILYLTTSGDRSVDKYKIRRSLAGIRWLRETLQQKTQSIKPVRRIP
jgi:GT2 family glycosyltransferase